MADRNRLNRCCGNKTKTHCFSYQYCSSRLNNFPRPSQPGSIERGLGKGKARLGGGWNIFWDEQESCSLRGKQTSPGLEFQFMITFTSPLVYYTAGFSVVTHGKVPLSWALGDNTKDGCFRNSFYLTVTGSWRKGLTLLALVIYSRT